MQLKRDFGQVKSKLIALNVHDAVIRLTEGGCIAERSAHAALLA